METDTRNVKSPEIPVGDLQISSRLLVGESQIIQLGNSGRQNV